MSYLGEEALVQSAGTLLLENSIDTWPGPVVFGDLSDSFGRVLDATLDDVHGGVENGAESATDGTRYQIIGHLALLGASLGEHLADLEDAAKVTGVPENMPPQGTLQSLIHGQDALVPDRLDNAVNHAIVLAGGSLVLEPNLDKLKGHDDERLGSAGGGTGQNGQRLVHLVHAKHVAVEFAPFVIGSEFGGTLGRLHENRSRNASIEARKAARVFVKPCKNQKPQKVLAHARLTLHA